ncbi:hypothetical protein Q3G72_005369 [Acer saccharum]|nr:hypothetical protein Q3G72_005369 [Acer saccharum]
MVSLLFSNSSSGDQLIEYETNHDQDDKPPVSDHGSGYDEGNNDEYEKIVLQNPSGYGSRGHDCQQVAADYGENTAATSGKKLQIISLDSNILR